MKFAIKTNGHAFRNLPEKRRENRIHSDTAFQPAIPADRVAPAVDLFSEIESAKPKTGHVTGEHQSRRVRRVSKDKSGCAQPDNFINEARRTGKEEKEENQKGMFSLNNQSRNQEKSGPCFFLSNVT